MKKKKQNRALKGRVQSSEHIRKRVESRKLHGTYKVSEETKKTISNTSKGRKPWNTGLKLSEDHKNNLRLAKLGKKLTPEHIKNAVEGRLKAAKERGYYFSPETLIKLGNINRGKTMSLEQREKLSKAWNYDKHVTSKSREKQRLARLNQVFPTRNSKPERMMQIALSLHGIKFVTHKPILGQPDIFIEPNLCIFVDGDYPHANPAKYDPDKIIWKKPKTVTASDIWARDSYVTHELSQLGYHVVRIWASVIKKDANLSAERIINLIKQKVCI